VLVGAGAGVLALVGSGAAIVGVALLWHHRRHVDVISALAPGGVGGVLLTVLGILLLPNAAVWAVAYALGPGFAVGTGTSVAPGEVVLGPLPAVPLLTALPGNGQGSPVGYGVLVIPVLAGVLIGVIVERRLTAPGAPAGSGSPAAPGSPVSPAAAGSPVSPAAPGSPVSPAAPGSPVSPAAPGSPAERATVSTGAAVASATGAGALAGLLLGVLAWFSGGSLGGGRMTELGPSCWRVALVGVLLLGLVAAATVLCRRQWAKPRRQRRFGVR
jgi:hypothetical protein